MMKLMKIAVAGGIALMVCSVNADLIRMEPVKKQDTEIKEVATQTTDWAAAAEQGIQSLLRHYWNSSAHYFNGRNDADNFNYWPQAHAMDAVIDAYLRTQDPQYKAYFEQWHKGIYAKNGDGYWNVFYDDMEWIGLTMLRLYDATKDPRYLETAQRLWRFVKYGWDEYYVEGGISWREDQPWSKNACSNGPGSLFASRMYRVTRDEADKEWAIKIYKWEREHLFDPETGAIADNIDGRSMRKAGFNLSYNQGLFLGAAHELYQLTGEESYLEDAQLAALFTITARQTLDRRNGILRDEGKDDGGLFKGIFMRYFVLLMLDDHIKPENQKKFRDFLYHNAEVLWEKGRDRERCLFGSSWAAAPTGSVTLTCQTSAVMFLEAVAFYERSLAAKKSSGDSKVEK